MLNVRENVPDCMEEFREMSSNALSHCLSNSLKFGEVGLQRVRHLESFQRFCQLFPHHVKQESSTESSVAFRAGKTRGYARRQDEPRRYAQPGKEIDLKARLPTIPECPYTSDKTLGQHASDKNMRGISGQLELKDAKREAGDNPLKKNFTQLESTTAAIAKENNHGVVSPCMELTVANKNSNYTPNACDRASVANLAVNCPKLNLARPDMAVLQPCQIDVLLSLAATEAPCSVMIENCKFALLSCDVDQMITNYLIAAKFQLSDVMDRLLDQIRCRFPNVCRTHEFLSLPVEVVEMFLTDGELQVETELDVFFAALTWIDFNKMDRLRHAGRVLRCVRYMYIDPRDIMTYIEPNIHLFTGVDGMEALLNMYRYKALVLSGTIPPPLKELYVPGGIPPTAPSEGVYPFGFTTDPGPIRNDPEPLPEYGFNMDSFRRQIASCYHRHGFIEDQQSRQIYGPESPCDQGSREISLRGICGMDSHGRKVFREDDSHHYGPLGGSEEDHGVSPWCKPDYHPGTHSDYRSSPFKEKDHDFNRGLPGQETDYLAIRRRIKGFKKDRHAEMDPKERRHSGEDRTKLKSGEDGKDRHSGEDGKERHSGEDGKERHSGEDGKERHSGEDGKERHSGEDRIELHRTGKESKGHSKRGKDPKVRRSGEVHKERHGGEGRKERHGGEVHKERHGGEGRKERHGGEVHKERHGGEGRKESHGGEVHKERHGGGGRKERHGGEVHKERHGGEGRKESHGGEVHKERHGGGGRKERHGGEVHKVRRHSVEDPHHQTERRDSKTNPDIDAMQLAKNLRKQVSFTGLHVDQSNMTAKADKDVKKKKKKKREKGDKSQERDRKASKGRQSIDLNEIIQPFDDVSADDPTSKGTSMEDLVDENPGVNNNAMKGKIMGVIGENEPVKVKGQCTFRSFSSQPRDEKGFQDIEFLDIYRDASFSEESPNDDISLSPPQKYSTEPAPRQRARSRAKLLAENMLRHGRDSRAIPPSATAHLGYRAKTCPGLSRRKGHRIEQRSRSLSLRSGSLI